MFLNKKNIFYLSGFSFLTLSEGVYDLAFAAIAFHLTGKAMTGAIVYALGFTSEIIVSLFLGGVLDSYNKLKIFMISILMKIIVFLSFVGIDHAFGLTISIIFISALTIDLLHHISKLTNSVSLLSLYRNEERLKMQGISMSLESGISIASPVLAGLLIAFLKKPVYLLLICVLFQLISLISFKNVMENTQLKFINKNIENVNLLNSLFSTFRSINEVFLNKILFQYFLITSLIGSIISTCVLLLFPFLSYFQNLEDSQIGMVFGFSAAGSFLTGIVISKYLKVENLLRVGSFSIIFLGFTLILLSINMNIITICVLIFIFNICVSLFFRCTGTFLQNNLPDDKVGSFWAAHSAVLRIFCLVGVLVGGFIFDRIGGGYFYSTLGILILSLGLIFTFYFSKITNLNLQKSI